MPFIAAHTQWTCGNICKEDDSMTMPTIPKILATTALCLAAMGLGLMFSLRGVSPELGVSGFTLAFLTFFPTIYTLFSEGANMPECRRRAIEAALPAFLPLSVGW
jgi:hypothetical protein